ncbi:sugar transferase [Haliangium ochraceum]|uniref:Sugar transferase n=1 Tax=Haliangium ochraceum (strain DSM 14365 / JCM 11303 / SMP-2) TaxID=502025 RepID=D0LHI9_HALO1|nr:sugar transferase [Haliangium ochraceum]ACY12851.1 sugar transferase [Haliangium ochraceum DSM 14365]
MRLSVRIAKRTIDICGALAGLAVTAPVMPVIAAAIYLDDRGPIFYKQRRAGTLRSVSVENGIKRLQFNEFHMHKFRTMRTDAEKFTGAVLASKGDPRITRVGRFLRKSRLDELPQLFEVLRGTMSLVGPRPERPELLQDLAFAIPFFEERMRDMKPGITGLAQVSLGYQGDIPEGSEIATFAGALQNPFDLEEAQGAVADDMRIKLLYDLAYAAAAEKLTSYLPMEMKILFKTPVIMIRGAGR